MRRVKPPPPPGPGIPAQSGKAPLPATPSGPVARPAIQAEADVDTGTRRRRAQKGLGTQGGPVPASLDASRANQSAVAARLKAFGLEQRSERVLTGKIVIESAADLEKLRGVTAIQGDLVVQETAKALDFAALSSLVEVTGRFTLEGNAAMRAVDFLGNLERVGSTMYVGFNDAVESIALPKLAHVGGAFIVEANGRLEHLALPALASVQRYLHVHDNPRLAFVHAPLLRDVQGDLSLVGNRRLVDAQIGAPVRVGGAYELDGNGAAQMASTRTR